MSDIKCKVVKVSDIISNEYAAEYFKGMIETQWDEVDHRNENSSLDVDFDKYIQMEEMGIHFLVLAFSKTDIVGFNSILISPSPHTKELMAYTDTIYVSKDHRGTGLGLDMIKVAEYEARSRGCKHMSVTFKNGTDHDNLVEEIGFKPYEVVYSKFIGD